MNPIHQKTLSSCCLLLMSIIGLCVVFSGCSFQNNLPDNQDLAEPEALVTRKSDAVHKLDEELITLLGFQDAETSRLAYTAIQQTSILARQYQITGFPLFHNFLVNVGIKDRGLCCHWTEDLLKTLNALELKQFRCAWVVSNYGNFREHNSVAVVPVNKELKDGLILDPWRNGGELYWTPIDQDRYKWRLHPGYKGISANITCETE